MFSALFGSTTFGGIAVDGFFLISGFLITGSFLSSRSWTSYLKKRIVRIFPGFLAAYFLCIFIVALLAGGRLPHGTFEIVRVIADAAFLQAPRSIDVFAGTPYPVLNGSVWTISYEFRCYLLLLALGMASLLRSRRFIMAAAILFTILALCVPTHAYRPFSPNAVATELTTLQYIRFAIIGDHRQLVRFIQIFLTGACFFVFRDWLRFPAWAMVVAGIALVAGCFSTAFVHIAVAVFGGYLILAFAFLNNDNVFARINNKEDISYGLYLSAWPIEKLLIWWLPGLPLLLLGLATFVLATCYGWLSWQLIERPVIERGRTRRRAPVIATGATDTRSDAPID